MPRQRIFRATKDDYKNQTTATLSCLHLRVMSLSEPGTRLGLARTQSFVFAK
jgi:hypothetical protein